jgi:hypothetical protein
MRNAAAAKITDRQDGAGERAAWFRDSEGNTLGIGQPVP